MDPYLYPPPYGYGIPYGPPSSSSSSSPYPSPPPLAQHPYLFNYYPPPPGYLLVYNPYYPPYHHAYPHPPPPVSCDPPPPNPATLHRSQTSLSPSATAAAAEPSPPPHPSNALSRARSLPLDHRTAASSQSSSSSSSASSSTYPISDLLANARISDPPPGRPAGSHHPQPTYPHYRPRLHQPSHSFSGSFSPHPVQVIAAGPPAFVGAIVPFVPSGAPEMHMVPYDKGQASLKVLLLHGNLDIWVCEAKYLPNMDMFSKTIGDMIGPRISSTLCGKLEHMSSMTSDPYVTVTVSGATVARTFVMSNTENPVWMQHFYVPVAHHAAEVRFLIKDSDVVGAQLIGSVSIPAEWIFSGKKVEGIYPILGQNGKQCRQGAILRLSIQFIPIQRITMYHHGVGAGPVYVGVPGTYFPLRKGGKVTLYQDAHVPDGHLPEILLGSGKNYVHGKCWHDIFSAINQARRLIYIVGWSVFHTVRLVRDTGYESSPTLGELLKLKSHEGVRVLLLVWDDPTSRKILGYNTNGIMGTHDEETRRFFKHSSVQVLLCPRSAAKRHSFVRQQETGTIYTHHQKHVIVDTDAGGHRRKLIAFVGGLDLCGGRYDSPEHPLFETLESAHKGDYHNPNFADYDISGPREPWHDLHCRIDGPAAYDVLTNFEERWRKASRRHGMKKLKKSLLDDSLLKIERIKEIVGAHDILFSDDNDLEAWHVQIFRSIDSSSAKGFPKDPRDATRKNLVCGKNILIDMSIHTAYVHAIRAAQHFIYIENQYFLGSSFNWESNKDLGANNLIPMEIAQKIANKIKANERFSAYIVIPMWPEGNPTGAATQRILFWQKKTMQMMYETVYRALKEVGLHNKYVPQDYLNFFCLGNRDGPHLNNAPKHAANPQGLAKKNRRFMIYVHSKGMIVDDEYVIIGSANINQRSLEGTRDTEISMGAYQPQHTWAKKHSGPRGQIYGYRMSLWAEHIGLHEECFEHPESLECMSRVRDLAQENWVDYAAEGVTETRGHLLKYPVSVDHTGKVKPLPGCETFPDLGGNICGSFIAIQENLTI